MKRIVSLSWRGIALVGLLTVNAALPAEAYPECWSCFDVGGPAMCLSGASPGHVICQPHGEHCDTTSWEC
jgi:hypothetical protein